MVTLGGSGRLLESITARLGSPVAAETYRLKSAGVGYMQLPEKLMQRC